MCPRIWSDLKVFSFGIDGYAGNPELWWWAGGIERSGKIYFMAKHASQESNLARIGLCIQSFIVDVREDQMHALCEQPVASQLFLGDRNSGTDFYLAESYHRCLRWSFVPENAKPARSTIYCEKPETSCQ